MYRQEPYDRGREERRYSDAPPERRQSDVYGSRNEAYAHRRPEEDRRHYDAPQQRYDSGYTSRQEYDDFSRNFGDRRGYHAERGDGYADGRSLDGRRNDAYAAQPHHSSSRRSDYDDRRNEWDGRHVSGGRWPAEGSGRDHYGYQRESEDRRLSYDSRPRTDSVALDYDRGRSGYGDLQSRRPSSYDSGRSYHGSATSRDRGERSQSYGARQEFRKESPPSARGQSRDRGGASHHWQQPHDAHRSYERRDRRSLSPRGRAAYDATRHDSRDDLRAGSYARGGPDGYEHRGPQPDRSNEDRSWPEGRGRAGYEDDYRPRERTAQGTSYSNGSGSYDDRGEPPPRPEESSSPADASADLANVSAQELLMQLLSAEDGGESVPEDQARPQYETYTMKPELDGKKPSFRDMDPLVLPEGVSAEKAAKLRQAHQSRLLQSELHRKRENERDQTKTQSRKVTACRFELNGRCTSGSDCEWSHDPDVLAEARRANERLPDVCKYFKVGSCNRGAECEFSHELKHEPCKFYHWFGRCKGGDKCDFSHAPLNERQQQWVQNQMKKRLKAQACRFYAAGKCKKSDEDCAFSHEPLTPEQAVRLQRDLEEERRRAWKEGQRRAGVVKSEPRPEEQVPFVPGL